MEPEKKHSPDKILYVDDETNLLSSFKRVFADENFTIVLSNNPSDALNLAQKEHFQIIACDYRMPDKNGIEFFKEILLISPQSIRILITGMCDFEAAVEAINTCGVFKFVTKPWSNNLLKGIFKEALETYHLREENERLNQLTQQQNLKLQEINQSLDEKIHSRTNYLLDSLVTALDYRDTETLWHSRRVSLYTLLVAIEMGITGQELIDIQYGSLLHDIGKIGVKDYILLKPGKLTTQEFDEMKNHCELGYKLVSHIDFLRGAAEIILQHHERWDGKGYPHGLQKDQIVLGARIFSVVDAYDAITSNRPYRKARNFEAAIEELRCCRGDQFDPIVIDTFLKIPRLEFEDIKFSLQEKRVIDYISFKDSFKYFMDKYSWEESSEDFNHRKIDQITSIFRTLKT